MWPPFCIKYVFRFITWLHKKSCICCLGPIWTNSMITTNADPKHSPPGSTMKLAASGHLDNIPTFFQLSNSSLVGLPTLISSFGDASAASPETWRNPRSVDEVLIASLCNNTEEFQPETSQKFGKKKHKKLESPGPSKTKNSLSIGRTAASSTVESADATSFDSTLGLSSAGSEAPVASRAETGRASFGWVALGRASRGPKLMAFFRLCIKRWSCSFQGKGNMGFWGWQICSHW